MPALAEWDIAQESPVEDTTAAPTGSSAPNARAKSQDPWGVASEAPYKETSTKDPWAVASESPVAVNATGTIPYTSPGTSIGAAPERGFWDRVKGAILGSPQAGDTPIGRAFHFTYEAPSEKHVPTTDLPMVRASELSPEITEALGQIAAPGVAGHQLAQTATGKGIGSGAAQVAEGMTTAPNLLMAAGSEGFGLLAQVNKLLPRAVSAGFSINMLHQAYEQFPEVKRAWDSGDAQATADAVTKIALTGGLGVLGATHAALGAGKDIETGIQEHNTEAQQLIEQERVQGLAAHPPGTNPIVFPVKVGKEAWSVETAPGTTGDITQGPVSYVVRKPDGTAVAGGTGNEVATFLQMRGAQRAQMPFAPPQGEGTPVAPSAIVEPAGRTATPGAAEGWNVADEKPIAEQAATTAPTPSTEIAIGNKFQKGPATFTVTDMKDGKVRFDKEDAAGTVIQGSMSANVFRTMMASAQPVHTGAQPATESGPPSQKEVVQPNPVPATAGTAGEAEQVNPTEEGSAANAVPTPVEGGAVTAPTVPEVTPKIPVSQQTEEQTPAAISGVPKAEEEVAAKINEAAAPEQTVSQAPVPATAEVSPTAPLPVAAEETSTAAPSPTQGAPDIASILGAATRKYKIGGEDMEEANPRAQMILKALSPEQRQQVNAMMESAKNPQILGSGFDHVVIDLGNGNVLRMGKPPAHQADSNYIPKPIESKMVGDVGVEVYPKLDTNGITDKDVEKVESDLAAQGLKWDDAAKDNLGKDADGNIKIIDGQLRNTPPEKEHTFTTANGNPIPITEIENFVKENGQVSTSALQRQFKMGYGAAANALDVLTERGILAPSDPQNPSAPRALAAPEEHNFSSTQFNMPQDVATSVRKAGNVIPDSKLAEGGRETEPHVTLLYGLHTQEPKDVAELLKNEGSITAKLGRTSVFKTPKADVLKIDVESPALHALNAKLAALPNSNEHPTYEPHVTIAYLRPGEGEQYAGKVLPALTGKTLTLGNVTFSDKGGGKTEIPLQSVAQSSYAVTKSLTPQEKLAANQKRMKEIEEQLAAVKAKTLQTGAEKKPVTPQVPNEPGQEITDKSVEAEEAPDTEEEEGEEKPIGLREDNKGERGSAPMLTDLAQTLRDRFGSEDAPKANYSGLGAIESRFAPGGNLGQIERASKAVHTAAIRAASDRAQAMVIWRQAAPLIKAKLIGSDITMPEFHLAKIQGRLIGLRDRWENLAKQAEEMPDEELSKSYDEAFSNLLRAISGKKDFPQDLEQTAAALYESKDMGTLREFLAQTFREAADSVTTAMEPEWFEAVTDTPHFKAAEAVYSKLVAKPMAENHAINDGVFSDATGPFSYYPLISLDRKQAQGPGRRLAYHKPKNIANAFATGMAAGYDPNVEPLLDRISAAVRSNDKAALLSSLEGAGLLRKLGKNEQMSEAFEYRGEEYEPEKVEISPGRLLIQNGKPTPIAATFGVMPKWAAHELRPILERQPQGSKTAFDSFMNALNTIAITGVAEPIVHASNLLGTLIANTPFLENSTGGKLMSAPFVKTFGAIYQIAKTDPGTEEATQDLIEMSKLGPVPTKYGSITFNRKTAEEMGSSLKRFSLAPILFGPKGIDIRARLVMYRLAKSINPSATPQELYHFVNQLGNYVPALQSEMERAMKRTGFSPFITAGTTMLRNGFNAWTGTGPMPQSGLKMRLWQQFTGGALFMLAAWILICKEMTGKLPWDDKRSKLMAVPAPSALRHSTVGKFLWGKGPEVGYINLGFFNPLIMRGGRAMGVPGAYETHVLGGNFGQELEAAQRDMMNSFAQPFLGPPVKAAFVGLTGQEPYVTGLRDREGHIGVQLFPMIPPKTKPGLPALEQRGIAAAREVNSFYGSLGEATGLLGKDQGLKGNKWAHMLSSYVAPGLVGNATNPFARSEMLREQRSGTR